MRDNNYLKYIGLASQMLVSLLLAFFAGNWLDKKFQFKFPVFTITLSMIVIISMLGKLIKDNTTNK